MKKDKTRYDLNFMVSRDDVTDSLGSPSASMSGISSPNYMRDTSSSSARKVKFLAISDSILSSSATTLKFPDSIKPHSGRRKSEKTWSVSGCSYSYCSLHGHQHQYHGPSPPLKEFISTRKLVNDRKNKKSREDAVHTTSVTKRDQSRQKVSIETHKAQAVHFASEEEEEDTGLDSHVTTIAKLRTEWAVEGGNPSDNSAATPRNKSHPADAIPLPVNAKETGDTVSESSQLSNELAIDRDSQDVCEGSTPSLAKEHALRGEELQGYKSSNVTVIPSVATFMDKEKYTSLWDLHLQDVEPDLVEKGEMQLSDKTDTVINTNNCSEFQAPTSFEFHEDEAIKLIEEAINELLTLPEQARVNLFSSTCTNSEEAVWDEVLENCREGSLPKKEPKQAETSMNIFETVEDEKTSPKENLSNIYSKLSKVIMCRNFIKAMSKMRQLKLKSPQELQHTTDPEAEGIPSLHQTEIAEKKSWQEWMLDYALQQVVSKLAPAQRKRVALLVQAFEIVSSQPKLST